jgi:hypothetical protein
MIEHLFPASHTIIELTFATSYRGILQNFGFFLEDDILDHEEEGGHRSEFLVEEAFPIDLCTDPLLVWNIPASREKFMKSCRAFHPDLQAVCA